MPYKVHTKDGNPYCVKKLNGEEVGCSDKEHIGAYLGKLDSVAENEIEESSLNIFKKGELKKKYEETKEKVVDAIKDESIKTSEAYKLITSGKKLTPEEKDKVKKQLGSLLTKVTKSAIFLAPGGSLVLLAFNLISNKVKKIEPEEIMENKLVGGRADNETIKDLSKKFRVTVKYLKQQLKKGMKVESEHTDDKEKQKEIASDHLAEFPNYYEELEGVEKKLKKYWKERLKEKVNQPKK